ncbi:hypothetical protein [[Limnothrix rosea] IAM M-220]|uniref:O-linked N-acetylglucosamine transferase family protein n=1 Tax=[Limnothrix rosea] IAM M-220 TaxID=454133 RepID=UPI000A048959|nr:hypothetical protein [[Limnothrix rosea] IAM M-220]
MQDSQPTFNPKTYLQLYLNGQYDQLSEAFIEVLTHFETVLYTEATPELEYFVDVFIKNFLYLFSQPDYIVGDRHALRFIQLNPVIANLTAISHQKTTDYYLQMLQKQPQNFIKILTLLNPRCTTTIDYPLLFDTNATLASHWYSYYIELYLSAQVNPIARKNLRNHIAYADDERLVEFANIADVYYGSTYINHEGDRPIKQRLNQAIRANTFCQTAKIQNSNPNPRKIAVITAFCHQNHSVYRTLYAYLKALVPDYELTLIYLGSKLADVDQALFKEVIPLEIVDGALEIEPIRQNDFAIAYFLDIGMSPESILLSNLRIAPIQIVSTGHPVSTYGSEIDYMMSGGAVEIRSLAAKHYDEKLILLPGNGAVYQCPHYELHHPKKARSEVVINCPWLGQKMNEPLIKLLGYIQKKATKKVFFRFFTSHSLRKNGLIPLIGDLSAILPSDAFEIILGQPDNDYMALLEEGDFTLDSYPFGGSNVMLDNIYLRKPIVGYEGKKWANRIGSQLLRQIGMAELVTTNANDYVKLALKLVDNTAYRQGVNDRLRNIDLDEKLFSTDEPQHFKRAIAYLLENHNTLQQNQSRRPIEISTDISR